MANVNTNYIMSLLFDKDIFYFQPKQLSTLLETNINKTYDIIQRLKKQNIIIELEKGKYLVTGFDKKRMLSNPFYIATHIVVPSYISFWSALNYYGFTEQAPRYILTATTKQKKQMKFEKYIFKYIKIKNTKLYGYKKEIIDDFPTFIAEPEKAIIDGLDQLNYAGGIKEISKIIKNALDTINKEILTEYAIKHPNKSMISRLGYLLEINGVKIKKLEKNKSKTFVLLNPKNKKTNIWNKKWNININEDL